MRYRRFGPLDRDLSVLVLGTAIYRDVPAPPFDILDAWLELGGNVLDTAREYGEAENLVGRWIAERGCRDAVVVSTKGAHHEDAGGGIRRRVTPRDITADLESSLEALRSGAIDLYLLHRDDPRRCVGPIVEVLNEQVRACRIHAFGASNWSTRRLQEANEYAAARGVDAFSCSSVNLDLAMQNEPPWPGAVSAHDPESLAWYEGTQTPVFSWSAQAGGFFTGRYSPYADIARVYASEANFERLRRATELAVRIGTTANNVALAWVLHQPFPTFAIIGPRTVAELRASVAAVELELTQAEVRWLDLREEGAQA